MAEIKRHNGQVIVDYMARDYDSLLRAMQDLVPYKLPEWTEHTSEADFGHVMLQLFAHMGDILSYYQDRVANESFLATAQTRRSIIHHLRLIGYRLATAAPASAALTLYFPTDCTDTVTIRRGDAFATKSTKDSASVRFEYNNEEDLVIDCATLDTVPVEDGERKVYTAVPVEEGRLIQDEYLGLSDAAPNQAFPLSHTGLILRSLGQSQTVNRDILLLSRYPDGTGVVEWTLRETLAFSRAAQNDFIVEIDENDQAMIRFGDGAFGAIPEAGKELRATYRVGGGTHGNVGRSTIATLADAPALNLVGAEVTNSDPATGGAEREAIDHAVEHAPAVFRSLRRAVTAGDYEALALEFAGVGKVRAEAANFNTVKLSVAPEGGGQVSDVLEANLLAYFEDKRAISTTIEIEDVTYEPIYVTAEVGVVSYYSPETVREKVEEAGADLLAFENVDFHDVLYLSKFYEAFEAVDGVAYVNITEFRTSKDDPGDIAETGRIQLGINEIPTAPDADEEPDYAAGIQVILDEDGDA